MWELLGAVIGAGMASGREVASFFATYGWQGYLGIVVACLTLGFLGSIEHPIQWPHSLLGWIWNALLWLMLVTTGGAMLSGAGEIIALVLPVHCAYWLGLTGTLILAWMLARMAENGLAAVSKVLLLVLGAVIGVSYLLPSSEACVVNTQRPMKWLTSGMMYGGFNAALQVPVLQCFGQRTPDKRLKIWRACGLLCMVLCLGNGALLRHPEWLNEPMPFVRAAAAIGRGGYVLSAVSLYFALLSTLIACFKGMRGNLVPMVAFVAVSQLGFTGVVEKAYPVLGGCCFAMLIFAKFMKCAAAPFHSRQDVI